jgi:pimeloyl-ACP methyl ester carboxylesterase
MPITKMLQAVQDQHYIQKPINLNIPILILWGDKDKVLPAEWAREYQAYLVGSQLEIISDCGHIPQKECFTDFENAVVKFLGIN